MYEFDHELVSHFAGSLLEHHASDRLPEEADTGTGGGDDHTGVDNEWADMHTATAGMEDGAERGR